MCKCNEDIYARDELSSCRNFRIERTYDGLEIYNIQKYEEDYQSMDEVPEELIEEFPAPEERVPQDFESIKDTLEGI